LGQTRVDLLHLLEDLRDAYPGALEETILTEIVANSLDSGAGTIRLTSEPARGAFTAVDDGSGMLRRELRRYHDIATSGKTRGQGIGFAGVGIKLGLLLCSEVLTETRRRGLHIASRWHLASRHKAPWSWIPPRGLVPERGTAVVLQLTNALSPLLDGGFIESCLQRHYQSLFEPAFDAILDAHYRRRVVFEVNGARMASLTPEGERAPIEVRLARKRKPSAVGYLTRSSLPLPEAQHGVAISTLGKVIKRGWDWLGITPSAPERIGGLIEAPALSAALTLNKADFIRTGPRGALYLAYRKAIQEQVAHQLAAWGDARDSAEEARRRAARPVERDLERVLADLADDFPLLAALVERRPGGQRRLPIGGPLPQEARELITASLASAAEAAGAAAASATVTEARDAEPPQGKQPAREQPDASLLSAPRGPRRPGRYGLTIQFESRLEDPELGRLIESTVWINDAHPAYRRAAASRSEGYHLALAVAMALAPLAVEPDKEHGFVTAFLERWGATLDEGRKASRRR
jgi:hypothetical protein